jgi:hypothetical protein
MKELLKRLFGRSERCPKARLAAESMWRELQGENDTEIAAIIVGSDGTWGTPIDMPPPGAGRDELMAELTAIRVAGH